MAITIHIDSEVLGPVRNNAAGQKVRDVIARIAVSWQPADGQERPNPHELMLLKPWCWDLAQWRLRDAHGADLSGEELDPPADVHAADYLPKVLNQVAARFEQGATANTHASFHWSARPEGVEEDPDGPDQLYWPEVLTDIGHWPGSWPYHAKVCVAIEVADADLPAADGLNFAWIEELAIRVDKQSLKLTFDFPQHPGVVAEASGVLDGTHVTLICRGSAAPNAPAAHQVLDLERLLVRPLANTRIWGKDWQQQVPDIVADALNPAVLVPRLIDAHVADGSLDPSGKLADRRRAIGWAQVGYRSLLQHLTNSGIDGNPGHGWLHDLVADGKASPGSGIEDLGRAAQVAISVLATPPDPDEIVEIDRAFESALSNPEAPTDSGAHSPWPSEVEPWRNVDPALRAMLSERLCDHGVMRAALELLRIRRLDATHLERLQTWVDTFATEAGQAVAGGRSPPAAARALMRSWLANASSTTHAAPWLRYLKRVAEVAIQHDDWSAYSGGAGEPSALQVLAEHACSLLHLGSENAAACSQILVASFKDHEPPQSGRLTPQLQDLVLSVDRPGSADQSVLTDLTSRIHGFVGFVRQAIGANPGPWYALNLATVELTSDDPALGALRTLALSPGSIGYTAGQRRLQLAFDGSAWVDDPHDRALSDDFGEDEQDSTSRHLGLKLSVQFPNDAKVPTIKDGVSYEFALLLIGAGNAVHPSLRGTSGHPADLDTEKLKTMGPADAHDDELHAVTAGRTLRVGAPSLHPTGPDSAWHDGGNSPVVPLAHEWLRSRGGAALLSPEMDATIAQQESEALLDAPVTLLVPETTWQGSISKFIRLHPPQVDRNAWLRWWDRSKLDADKPEAKDAVEARIQAGLRSELKLAEEGQQEPSSRRPGGFDDPAVCGYRVSVRQCFPENAWSEKVFVRLKDQYPGPAVGLSADALGDLAMRPFARPELHLQSSSGPARLTLTENDNALLTCVPGAVYALRIEAAVPRELFSTGEHPNRRFIALQGEEKLQQDADYVYFTPARFLVEVATDQLLGDAKPPNGIQDMAKAQQVLWDALLPQFVDDEIRVDLGYTPRKHLEYFNHFRLIQQQWNWRGRPVALPPSGSSLTQPDQDWIDELFDGRSDADAIEIARTATANAGATQLLSLPRLQQDQTELWRFGLVAESRYSAIAPKPVRIHAGATKVSASEPRRFKSLLIGQRGDRCMPKPQVRICLPLMRELPLDATQATDTLLGFLVELDEPWHREAGPGEQLVAEVVMSPHFDRVDQPPQAIAEIGTVPTVGADLWPDLSVELKVIGVYGQTLDPDSGAASYSRASAMVTLSGTSSKAAKDRWLQGNLMLRVRFGRRVQPTLDSRAASVRDRERTIWSAAHWIELPPPSNRVGPYALEQLRLRKTATGVQLSLAAAPGAQAEPLQLTPSQMARPYAFLVLTEEVLDARGLPGGERLLDVRLLQADQPAPYWPVADKEQSRLRGYVYWIEPQREVIHGQNGPVSQFVLPQLGADPFDTLAALFEPQGNGDAKLRIVQMTQAIT